MGRKLIFFVFSLGLAMSLALPMAAAWDSVEEEDDSVPSFAPDEEVGEEDLSSAGEKTDSAEQREESYAPSVDAEQSAGMEPYHLSMMGAQSLVGLAVIAGTILAGLMGTVISTFRADDVYSSAGLWILASGPVLTPLAVNLVGNLAYPNQFLGGFIGGIAGTLAAFVAIFGAESLGTPGGGLGLILYPLGTVGGSVLGYHMQANMRYEAAEQERSGLSLAPAPIVDSARESVGMGLRLQGRF